ncbi:YqeG family HAD IIIA-type phosphatase [Candidatus Atribacteria bacterium HGW-Atribacteria-1]|nr:MAG: YqeG family HAD IIIA-type phosphatase [Candidatus Atribacteria bacterium HGW-Atribacteria-1]
MFEILKPKVYVNSVYNIDLKKLKKIKKIKGIIVDLDNTLVAWGEKEVSQRIVDWVKEAKKIGLKICIVSNTNSKRVAELAQIFDIPYHSKYFKPFSIAFNNGLKILDTKKSETVVIGDQIFTDIWGGNRLKLLTILVTPIVKKDSIGTFLHRNLEKILISFWLKKSIIKKEAGNWPK